VKTPFHGSETQVGHVGGKTTRFFIVAFRIRHSENRCGYWLITPAPAPAKAAPPLLVSLRQVYGS
jgi:hypothetical protein